MENETEHIQSAQTWIADDTLQINLFLHGGLLETGNEPWLRLLEQVSEIDTTGDQKIKVPKKILLLQKHDLSDFSADYLNELRHIVLREHLEKKIWRFRRLLAKIRSGEQVWVYAGAYDCYGTHADLAFSCEHRYWFSRQARIGFPEIRVGIFPCGGSLEVLAKRFTSGSLGKDTWQANPVYVAQKAAERNLISLATDAETWSDVAVKLVSELNPEDSRSDQKENGGKSWFSLHRIVKSVANLFGGTHEPDVNAIDSALQQSLTIQTGWDHNWDLSERNSGQSKKNLVQSISKGLLSESYSHWVERRLTAKSALVSRRHLARLPRRVFIDLNQLFPPIKVLARLLQNNIQIVFLAATNKQLQTGMGTGFRALETIVPGKDIQQLWMTHVSWFTTQDRLHTEKAFAWGSDNYLRVFAGEKTFKLLRFEGNSLDADCGYCEWPDELAKLATNDLVDLMNIMTDGLAPLAANQLPLPLSDILSASLLSEVARAASEHGCEVEAVLDGLRNYSWRIGEKEYWEKFFLRIRSSILPGSMHQQIPKWFCIDWDLLSIQHLKEIRAIVREATGNSAESRDLRWSNHAIHQHFNIFLGLLVMKLVEEKAISTLDLANVFARSVAGFPSDAGNPTEFFRLMSPSRLAKYTENKWPLLAVYRGSS